MPLSISIYSHLIEFSFFFFNCISFLCVFALECIYLRHQAADLRAEAEVKAIPALMLIRSQPSALQPDESLTTSLMTIAHEPRAFIQQHSYLRTIFHDSTRSETTSSSQCEEGYLPSLLLIHFYMVMNNN